jgi:hypothetical protein
MPAPRHGARFYLPYGRSFPNKLARLGQIEELMKKCLVQVSALKEGFVAPVVVAQVIDSIFGARRLQHGSYEMRAGVTPPPVFSGRNARGKATLSSR